MIVSRRRAHVILTVLSFAAFLFVTSEILPFGLIAIIADDLGRTEPEIARLVTAYALTIIVVSIPVARLAKGLAPRTVLTTVLALYAVGMVVAAFSGGFAGLLGGRVLTAAAQALFWASVTPAAAGLFETHERGKALSRLLIGPAAGGVVGLPIATWAAQHFGWRVPFVGLAIVSAATAAVILVLIPRYRADEGAAARGLRPSRRAFALQLAVTATTILGMNLAVTYITPYLRDVAGVSAAGLPTAFLISGIAGLAAMVAVGRFVDRFPLGTMAVGIGLVAAAWAMVAVAGSTPAVAVAGMCVSNAGLSAAVATFAARIMRVAPESTDMAIATYAVFYNSGTAIAPLVGGRIYDTLGVAALPGIGAAVVAVALVLLAASKRAEATTPAPEQAPARV